MKNSRRWLTKPQHGRYIPLPAIVDSSGVRYVPPAQIKMAPLALGGIAFLLSIGLITGYPKILNNSTMNTDAVTNSGNDSIQSQTEQNANTSKPVEVEKGSGYGLPNEGSGETVAKDDLAPDGQPIPGAGTSAQSGEIKP